jgi:hypothetical protein
VLFLKNTHEHTNKTEGNTESVELMFEKINKFFISNLQRWSNKLDVRLLKWLFKQERISFLFHFFNLSFLFNAAF